MKLKKNLNFCEILQHAQEPKLIQKTTSDVEQRRDKTTGADRVLFSYNDWEHDKVVKASFRNSHSQVKEKFAALQTSTGTVANRLDKLDATVARQGDVTQQLMKSRNENLSQLTSVMTQMSAVMITVMAASTNDQKTVLVGVVGGLRGSRSGQPPKTKPLKQSSQNSSARFAPNLPLGYVSLTNPPLSRVACYESEKLGFLRVIVPNERRKSII